MKTIQPFDFRHTIQANASKSDAQRCLILSAFSKTPTKIYGLDQSDDVQAMLTCLKELGAHYHPETQLIEPIQDHSQGKVILNVNESGFALRTLSFVGMAATKELHMLGEGTLQKRDQTQLCQILKQLGFQLDSNEGRLPLLIQGSVTGSNFTINGEAGSQAISGLFMLAPLLKSHTKITIESLKSQPYFEMTIARMKDFGIMMQQTDTFSYEIEGQQTYDLPEVYIEGDWSGAANLLVGAAISGTVQVSGLSANSLQADRAILEALQSFGATIRWEKERLVIEESVVKNPFEFHIDNCPDLFPILVILACAAEGRSSIYGVTRLKNKESDRLMAMSQFLRTNDIHYDIELDVIHIHGIGSLQGGMVHTFDDHRIAMAGTISACISENSVELTDEKCVAKSYPNFFHDVQSGLI